MLIGFLTFQLIPRIPEFPSEPKPLPTRTFTDNNDFPSETATIDPAHTRRAAHPAPEQYIVSSPFTPGAATTAIEYVQHETEEPSEQTVVVDRPRSTFRPRRSFWDW